MCDRSRRRADRPAAGNDRTLSDERLVRLNKLLSLHGVTSRRGAARLIRDGRVEVGGQVVDRTAALVDPTQEVRVNGVALPRRVELEYVAYHKPVGLIVTRSDPAGRETVTDTLPEEIRGLHPVGRLDRDTSGLLLLTNDGDFTLKMTHPRHAVPKVYIAHVDGRLSREALGALRAGVTLRDGPTRPAEARVLREDDAGTVVELTLREGRKRQVRRMLRHVGTPVIHLRRVAVGPVTLGDLAPGAWRPLTPDEVTRLKRCAEPHALGGVEETEGR